MMASSEANQPVQKQSVPRPRPRPVAKKTKSETNRSVQKLSVPRSVVEKTNAGGESSAVVFANAQETMLDKGNKKRSNPVGDEGGNATDLTTPVRPAKKVKGGAQAAKPLRRTGICFICYFLKYESLIK